MRKSLIRRIALLLITILFVSFPVFGEVFKFKYYKGEKYRILSTVNEELYINGLYSHTSDIMNKILIEVVETGEGSGLLDSRFVFTDRAFSGAYVINEEYSSYFWRDESGYYSMDDSYYMPVVRNVPVFPDVDIQPGDTWTAAGYEVHDFRAAFGIEEAYRFPVNVRYIYSGKGMLEGEECDLISAEYTVFYKPPPAVSVYDIYPLRISGYSKSTLYWDNERGRVSGVDEEFELVFDISNGQSFDWRGTSRGRVVESSIMEKDIIAGDIREKIIETGIPDTEVKVDESGVTLVLDNIRFSADSAYLLNAEKLKLDKIIGILELYADRDILVTGHTALAGTAEGRRHLSEERAKIVGNYILRGSSRSDQQMTIRGMGAMEPVSDNNTERGMSLNRRVEITILEN